MNDTEKEHNDLGQETEKKQLQEKRKGRLCTFKASGLMGCGAYPLRGGEFCFMHQENKDVSHQAQLKGGKKTQRAQFLSDILPYAVLSLRDARRAFSDLLALNVKGQLSNARFGYCLRALNGFISVQRLILGPQAKKKAARRAQNIRRRMPTREVDVNETKESFERPAAGS